MDISELEKALANGNDVEILPNGEVTIKEKEVENLKPITFQQDLPTFY